MQQASVSQLRCVPPTAHSLPQEIIERQPHPPQSLILLGRSGTGAWRQLGVARQAAGVYLGLELFLQCVLLHRVICLCIREGPSLSPYLPNSPVHIPFPPNPPIMHSLCRQDDMRCVPHVRPLARRL